MICAMKDYFKRICDGVLAEELAGMGAALVQGPKWCGKTTTCEQLAKSVLYMNDPKRRSQYLQMAESDITELMAGDRPRLIDERFAIMWIMKMAAGSLFLPAALFHPMAQTSRILEQDGLRRSQCVQ